MAKSNDGQSKLENAYKLKTAQDNIAYYKDFAATYDDGFAVELGYRLPALVGETYLQNAGDDDVPIADIGCGTGLVAAALNGQVVDGIDISPAMLKKAETSGRYRSLFAVDLTDDISTIKNGYGAVLSAGTFTHGHLGPEQMVRLLDIARPGALFVISVNEERY